MPALAWEDVASISWEDVAAIAWEDVSAISREDVPAIWLKVKDKLHSKGITFINEGHGEGLPKYFKPKRTTLFPSSMQTWILLMLFRKQSLGCSYITARHARHASSHHSMSYSPTKSALTLTSSKALTVLLPESVLHASSESWEEFDCIRLFFLGFFGVLFRKTTGSPSTSKCYKYIRNKNRKYSLLIFFTQ